MKAASVIVLALLAVGGVGTGAFFLLNQKKKHVELTPPVSKTPAPNVNSPGKMYVPEVFKDERIIPNPRQPEAVIGDFWSTIIDPPKQLPIADTSIESRNPSKSFEPPPIIRLPVGEISPVHSIVPMPVLQRPAEPLTRPVTVIKAPPVVEHPTFTATTRPIPPEGKINPYVDVPTIKITPPPSVERTYHKEVEVGGFTTRPNTDSPAKHIAAYVDLERFSDEYATSKKSARYADLDSSFSGRAPSRKGFNA